MIKDCVIVRGGGDIATGTIQKLYRSGFNVLILETKNPTSIRRTVCFSEAVYDGQSTVEGIKAVLVQSQEEIFKAWENRFIPLVVDEKGIYIDIIRPEIVVDAILAKKNLGTNRAMAPTTIALGPGFYAGKDVDVVIETMRGHNLGRLIFEGPAIENTGIPGEIGGHSKERVIHSKDTGIIKNIKTIGNVVKANETIAYIGETEVKATIDGVLRGLIREGSYVNNGLKIADIDPRLAELDNYNTISDKARNIGGGVLEAILLLKNQKL
ncbi:selenium-dependent molybdenum cofactor biosynthesis protein YqeB [Candidatus Clostridium radicumherbarum]|uniref:Selenium-dependent molybdenum cofactor biosynthesis protein YqeB n=1 Tax=Candidatus Clostridium radicumherbarum TaxID=3381662 RepID=A0ABW8TQ43_9CLOT